MNSEMFNDKGIFTTDLQEEIDRCLVCQKERCDNCLGGKPSKKNKRPRKRTGRLPIKTARIDHETFMELYNKRYTDRQIGEAFGVSHEVIYQYRKKHGLPTKRPKPGIDKEKLTELWECGWNDREIAEELGVATAYICKVRKQMGLPTKHPRNKEKK